MSRACTICEKQSLKAANRSHAKNKTLRKQKVNLQKMDGKMVCTRCMRNLAKTTK